MNDLNLKKVISSTYKPFLDEILSGYKDNIHSIHITGSALTDDFDPKISDINSVFILQEMDLKFLELLAPMGKKYGKKKIAAPLIMTPDYIMKSLDVFPIEILNIKLLHHTVMGEDIFQDLEIKRSDLRHQCERELKVKLIGLRQGYIAYAGDRKTLTAGFVDSFSGYIPLLRAIIVLFGKEPPVNNAEVIIALEKSSSVNTHIFQTVLRLKREKTKPTIEQLNTIFEDYYEAIEKLGEIADAIEV